MTGNSGKGNITASICSHTCLLFTGRKAWVFSLLKLQVSKRMSIYLTANCVSKLWWIVMLRVHCKVFHQISINKMGLSPSVDIYVYAGILMVLVRRRDQIQRAGRAMPPSPPSGPLLPFATSKTTTRAVHNTAMAIYHNNFDFCPSGLLFEVLKVSAVWQVPICWVPVTLALVTLLVDPRASQPMITTSPVGPYFTKKPL